MTVSTESAIFKLESIFSAWNNEYIMGLFCDLTKAFDGVSHELLILKLEFYGVKSSILTLNLLTTTIVAPPGNANKWQIGFNSTFKGLNWLKS